MEPAPSTGPIVLLTRLARVVHRRSTEEMLGMRLKDLWVLAYLRDGPMSQQAMMDALSFDANHCVLLLNELESSGFVERRRDPADRRRHIVELTTAGLDSLKRAEHAQESIEDDVLAALDAGDRAALGRLLQRALDGVPSEPPTLP
ncbi:MAG TPA: MarR family winged helix-turn-helix transcriptional regulator [Solirubrobacteraceae bacterium]|nr:MarR family winged helix-turn-helix transcriptional regulator [Solirubrobacteraceae bacterium]